MQNTDHQLWKNNAKKLIEITISLMNEVNTGRNIQDISLMYNLVKYLYGIAKITEKYWKLSVRLKDSRLPIKPRLSCATPINI